MSLSDAVKNFSLMVGCCELTFTAGSALFLRQVIMHLEGGHHQWLVTGVLLKLVASIHAELHFRVRVIALCLRLIALCHSPIRIHLRWRRVFKPSPTQSFGLLLLFPLHTPQHTLQWFHLLPQSLFGHHEGGRPDAHIRSGQVPQLSQ